MATNLWKVLLLCCCCFAGSASSELAVSEVSYHTHVPRRSVKPFSTSAQQLQEGPLSRGVHPLGGTYSRVWLHFFRRLPPSPDNHKAEKSLPNYHPDEKTSLDYSSLQSPKGRNQFEVLAARDNNQNPDGGDHGREVKQQMIIGMAIAFPLVLVLVLAVWLWCKFSYVAKSGTPTLPHRPTPEPDSNSNSQSNISKIQLLGSWLASFHSLSTSFSSHPSRRRQVVWLSSACEMHYSKLQAATNNFSAKNLLGEGGTSRVYRAKMEDDTFAAVKRLDAHLDRRQTAMQFQSEVQLMRQVRHPNLVSLIGFCKHGDQRLLVYEVMQNGSLEDQLYGPSRGSALTWNLRIKIALEAARGLEYLHEHCVPPVVHRDLKASNILLDANFNAKISDFGLATPLEGLSPQESLQLIGTVGYVAPEFFETGTLTEKSDVYAFGVVLLELLTGRKPIDHSLPPEEYSLVNWAKPQLTDRKRLPHIVAPTLRSHVNIKHLHQVAAVATLCVCEEPSYRPLIADVVQSLVPLVPIELGGALRPSHAHNPTSPSPDPADMRSKGFKSLSRSFSRSGKFNIDHESAV